MKEDFAELLFCLDRVLLAPVCRRARLRDAGCVDVASDVFPVAVAILFDGLQQSYMFAEKEV
jgi:hypothetical protein